MTGCWAAGATTGFSAWTAPTCCGAGRDLLSGGSGEDVFVFGTGYGTDRVTDFGDGDRLDLRGLEVAADFDDVMEMAREGPAGLILDFGTDRLVLEGLSTNDLSVDDVLI